MGFVTLTLCDAGAIFYQLSHDATQLGVGQFFGIVFFSVFPNDWSVPFSWRAFDDFLDLETFWIFFYAPISSSGPSGKILTDFRDIFLGDLTEKKIFEVQH